MKKFSPGVWPTVMTVPAVLIMLTLSVWQLNRYNWKVDLVDTLNQQLAEAPVFLPGGVIDPEDWGYRRVMMKGEFLHEKEIHLFSHAVKGRKGFQVITPFVRTDNQGIVLVNRGWVPDTKKDADNRKQGLQTGELVVSGIVKKPWSKGWSFMPDSNEKTNVWLYGEIDRMATYLNMEVAPVFVELDKSDVPGGWPLGGQTRISIPNNHIEYFFTWLGLAVAMSVIFVVFGLNRGRNQES
ncbi:MAG: SURF1 family protein [Sneathiella sp.]|nr:SURF1 family protein [Sneathiella sp.]